jgi:predicted acetyltransferase
MSIEIRPIKPEELDEFKRVAATALIMKPSAFEGMRPEWTLCAFEDGKLATSFGAWPLTMRFNGEGVPVSGVTCVGTLPVYRRHGHLRQVMTSHFQILHEQGERHIASLWASWAAIYQRFGYGIVGSRYIYTVEPRYLQFSYLQEIRGTLRESHESEFELLVSIYRKFVENRTGYLHRSKPTWDFGVLSSPPTGGTLNRVVYEEHGEPLGYMIYATQPHPGDPIPNHRIVLRDLVWLNNQAYRAFWEHLATMDLAFDVQWGRAPTDDPLPHLMLEPRRLKAQMADGILNRIVTVEKAMTQRKYTVESDLVFEVTPDELCPWNTGRWKLSIAPGGSRIVRTRESPQLTVPIGTLALLVFGQVSATEAARMGRLEVNEPGTLPVWDEVMKTEYKPACPDMF